MNAIVGNVKKLPVVVTTSADEYALIGPIISSHMIGKVTPGGVQLGITRSLKPLDPSPSTALDLMK